MDPVSVIVVGPERAELWRGADQRAVTVLYDGPMHLQIDPRPDGRPWLIDVTSLTLAVDEAARKIGP